MAKLGATNVEIADELGVSEKTFQTWLIRHPKLKEALLIPKEAADNRVELSLFKNANDRWIEEEEIKVLDGQIVRVKVRKFIRGDVTAQLAWLNNRRRDNWQRNPEPEIEAPSAPVDDAIELTPDNARQIARRFALVLVEGGKKTA